MNTINKGYTRRLIKSIAFICITWLLTGCTALPDARAIRRALGIEQTFAHNDVPAPSSMVGAIRALRVGQTITIRYTDPVAHQKRVITDPQHIAAIIDVFRRGSQAQPHDPATAKPTATLQIQFVATPTRELVLVYYPQQQSVKLFNIPNAAWPDHLVADYAVSPSFGQALLEALQLATP